MMSPQASASVHVLEAEAPAGDAREREFQRLLAEWNALPPPRPDFLTYAHPRRRATRT